jgi:hypothetical protein
VFVHLFFSEKWTNKPIKSLGIYYAHDYIECEKLNWEKKNEKMNSSFLSWSKRNLSMLGKVFQFENFESANLLIHDAFKDIKQLSISIIFSPLFSKSPNNVFRLTLSGFPFHINLKHLLSISFWEKTGGGQLHLKINIYFLKNGLIVEYFLLMIL